ncbi:MAG: DUF1385 domain-containing protein [Clostridia bacterium]|nr:DUF1385 domain-containing protein [Clostridia bacterium]
MRQELKSARSFYNGILFNSSSNSNYTTMVTIDENENIKTEWLPKKEAEKIIHQKYEKKSEGKSDEKIESANIISAIMFTVCMFIFVLPPILFDSPIFMNIYKKILLFIRDIFFRFLDLKFLVIVLLFSLIIIISFLLAYSYIDVNFRRFHAAEHMIAHAYNNLHRIPSIEELAHYSRFHTYCGANNIVLFMISLILGLLFLLFDMNIYLCFITFLVFTFFKACGLLNFVQLIVTKPATERELRLAVIGLSAWLENEQKNEENNFSDFS